MTPIWFLLYMETEYTTLMPNNTWQLVLTPSHANIVGCCWLYKLKYALDGTISRYKACLVAQGFNQTSSLDYFEIFSLVVKASTIHIVLAIAVSFNWPICQLDVQNAFLNGELDKQVFMAQPPGFNNPQFPPHVCKLNKPLYGLK